MMTAEKTDPLILVVEDEPKLAQLMIDYLEASNYRTHHIAHGNDVLPFIQQTPPDLMLLDLMLPGKDGLSLCREIRRFSELPIIMVTARTVGLPLTIDEGRFQASWREQPLELTPAEFRLLKTLALEPGKVFSREQLLNHLYDDYRVVTDRTIDSHIKNLRRKLENLDADQPFIRAVYGMGYRWEADLCQLI